ncbi:putative isotrichodermin c-15 hydroxylase protein [Rosellinia necatrix]|uniref:Putative isotrichodermin c-15 hydroxylase protein n=1 Tax=Rosellinia necatrix TaxID=77044 RepID=A0A1S8A876_ROSNE|nr:putative isotrichodermin c-15 hydroxylase protein [Rosellinia necatrix]
MRNEEDSAYLSVTLGFNKFVTMTQVLRRFPALGFLRFAVFPVSLMGNLMELRKTSLAELHRRITLQGATEHLDYFGQLVPADGCVPDTDSPKEILHLSRIATQLMFAGYLPPSDWYYGAFSHLLHNREYLDILAQEIGGAFASYDEITPSAAASLPYINACLKESLRLFSTGAVINGMPVYSPGATVDGRYIPKGTTCQSNSFSVSRSPRHFRNAHQYRPQR